MSKRSTDIDPKMLDDIRELCVCCAKAVVVISHRYNEDPRLVSELFHQAYRKINDDINHKES